MKIEESINMFYGMPQYMWEGVFSTIATLGTGLIVAFITTFYLKKKDEVTRVSGVILEKRINGEQQILDYLEKLSFHFELHNGKEEEWRELLTEFGFEIPNGGQLQYSAIFTNAEEFRSFFKGFEEIINQNKLWLDKRVRQHLMLMQAYFSWVNSLLIAITRVPLPEGETLTDEELKLLSNIILLQAGITLDDELNGLLAHLETLIVDSIYKLDLARPKKSMVRNGMKNRDMLWILKELEKHTKLGRDKEKYFLLVMMQVYKLKGIDYEDLPEDIKFE